MIDATDDSKMDRPPVVELSSDTAPNVVPVIRELPCSTVESVFDGEVAVVFPVTRAVSEDNRLLDISVIDPGKPEYKLSVLPDWLDWLLVASIIVEGNVESCGLEVGMLVSAPEDVDKLFSPVIILERGEISG